MLRIRRWPWVVFVLSACGGSASETPFPEEPLPDYLAKPKDAPAASATTSSSGVPTPAPTATGSAAVKMPR